MFSGLRVGVVVPAFNEERAIARTVTSIPKYVDRVIVVDDASHDRTIEQIPALSPRVDLQRHPANRGVGAAIATGYRRALALDLDVVVVMAGDAQMDPRDLPALLAPVARGEADYAKGNRFRHADIWHEMPPPRLLGNVVLSLATKVTSGYWHVFDSQCGYTAINRRTLTSLDLDKLFPRYGYPNDLLSRLHAVGARVVDVPVRPVYGPDWKSGISIGTALYPIAFVLARSFATRVARESVSRMLREPAQLHDADQAT